MPQGVYSGYGLPANYTTNPMYQYYMMQMIQQQQQMALLAQQQREQQMATQQVQMDAYLPQQQDYSQVAVGQTQQPCVSAGTLPPQTGDGKDDGKISWGKKLKNFGKGIGNFFKGMVCDENGKFSWKRTLSTVAVVGGAIALTVATSGAAAPYLIAAGATMATVQTGKGVYKACTAKTDREAEQAWQEIGTGATGIVASVAGAKGALKSAGVAVPKGNAVTSSLRATVDCFKITGKGLWSAKGSMLHPIQTARSIRNYWSNTAKPNLQQAFSYKNGYKNYTEAEQVKINKKINDIDSKMSKISEELQKPDLSDARRVELNTQYNDLIAQRANAEVHSAYNTTRMQNGPSASTSRKDCIKVAEENLKSLQEQLKTATGEQKAAIEADIKLLNKEIKYFKNNFKIDGVQERINRAQRMISELEAEKNLPTQSHNLTSAQQARLNTIDARINTLKGAIARDKQILRNANYKLAAQQHLPKVGLAYGSSYLSGAAPQTINDEYAQLYGFDSKDQMIEAAAQQGMTAEQLADAIDQQLAAQGLKVTDIAQQQAAQQQAQQAAAQQGTQQGTQQYNPYATSPFGQYAYPQPMQYMGDNTFRFNELYQSPYPDMIA